MRSDLSRSSAFVASLLALAPPHSAPCLAVVAGSQRSGDRSQALFPPLFPYPQSVKLLDAIDGALVPPRRPGDAPLGQPGERAIPFPAAAKLMDEVLAAGRTLHALALEMRTLAVEAQDPTLSPEQRARLDQSYQMAVARGTEIVRATAFAGFPLLDGSRDVLLVVPPSRTRTMFVDLPDWRASQLGLLQSVATLLQATSALDEIDVAIDRIEVDEARLGLARRELLEGDPDGGLREVERLLGRMRVLAEQATDGTLNTGDRTVLDRFRRSDLARLEDVSKLQFDGLAVLDSGSVVLQGALGTSLQFDLPAASPDRLGLSDPREGITTVSSATETLERLEDALAAVRAERSRVAETRAALENGLLLLR